MENVSIVDNLQALWMAILLAILSSWIAWQRGFFHFSLNRKPIVATVSLGEVVFVFIIFLGVMLFVAPLISLLIFSAWTGRLLELHELTSNPILHGWVNVLSISLSSLAVIGFSFSFGKRTVQAVWGAGTIDSSFNFFNYFVGMATWLICFPLVIVINQTLAIIYKEFNLQFHHEEQVAVKFLRTTTPELTLFVCLGLLIIFVVPILEELLFRGFLQTWLRQKLGFGASIIIASIIFAAFHFSASQGMDNIELLASLFVLSCYLGYVYERQQSLWASIGLHSTFNGINVLAILLTTKNPQ